MKHCLYNIFFKFLPIVFNALVVLITQSKCNSFSNSKQIYGNKIRNFNCSFSLQLMVGFLHIFWVATKSNKSEVFP